MKSEEIRQQAQDMYLEGLGFRAIGRVLKVSHTAVYSWIKQAGKTVELPVEKKDIEVANVDKIHTYWPSLTVRWDSEVSAEFVKMEVFRCTFFEE